MTTSLTSTRLPDSWIRKIFATMQGNYGSRWGNMWKIGQTLPDGSDVGIVNAMDHWAEKLGKFKNHPQAIKAVLNNLPTNPPTLPEFIQLCRNAYVPEVYIQLENKPTEEQMEKNRQRLKEVVESLKKNMTKN